MEVLEQMTAVVAVLALLGGSLWFLRRRGFAGLSVPRRRCLRQIECLERVPIGPQHTLHLVRVGERELLLAASPAGCTLIEAMPRREAIR